MGETLPSSGSCFVCSYSSVPQMSYTGPPQRLMFNPSLFTGDNADFFISAHNTGIINFRNDDLSRGSIVYCDKASGGLRAAPLNTYSPFVVETPAVQGGCSGARPAVQEKRQPIVAARFQIPKPAPQEPAKSGESIIDPCSFCEEQSADMLFVPCGHKSMCGPCTIKYAEAEMKKNADRESIMCPSCRGDATSVIRIINATAPSS